MRIPRNIPPLGERFIDALSRLEQVARRRRRQGLIVILALLAVTTCLVGRAENPDDWLALFLLPPVLWAWIFGVRGGLIGALVTTAGTLVVHPPPLAIFELGIGFMGVALFVGVAGRAVRRADKRAGVLERLVAMLGTLSPTEAPDNLRRQVVENAAAIANARGGCLALWNAGCLTAVEWWDGRRWHVAPYAWSPSQSTDPRDCVSRAWRTGEAVQTDTSQGSISFYGRSCGALAAAPFGPGDGVEQGVLVVFRQSDNLFDQTDRSALHAFAVNVGVLLANASLYAEALAASVRRRTFVTQVSHELGTPLHVVRGCVDSLAEFHLSTEAAPYLQHLQRNLGSLEELVKESTEFAALENERIEVAWASTPVDEVFSRLRERFAPLLASDVSLDARIAKGAELVWADSAKLYTILSNLTANAVKYTAHGSVQLSAEMCDGGIEISVVDTGIGIEAAALPAIFEPFYRGQEPTAVPGFGLGLTIAERLARALGTRLRVASARDGGSVFSVLLDVPRAHAIREVCHDAA